MAVQKYKGEDGVWRDVSTGQPDLPLPIPVNFGGTGAATLEEALHNLGIYWGESLPDSETPGIIYLRPIG